MKIQDVIPWVILGVLVGGIVGYVARTPVIEFQKGEIETLTQNIVGLENNLIAKNSEVSSLSEMIENLEDEVLILTNQLIEFESITPVVDYVATGIDWVEAGNYKLQSSFLMGYDDDFLVIYEVDNMLHDLTFRLAIDVYIITGGSVYDSRHYTDEGTLPAENWFMSYWVPFDISWYQNTHYTVIVTVTDLISGQSNSKTASFQVNPI